MDFFIHSVYSNVQWARNGRALVHWENHGNQHLVRGPLAGCPRERRAQRKPHRYPGARRLRAPDPLQPLGGISARHDEAGLPSRSHRRVALAAPRRDEQPVTPCQGRKDLGRVGRRERRPRPHLWQAVAKLGGRKRAYRRPDFGSGRADQD